MRTVSLILLRDVWLLQRRFYKTGESYGIARKDIVIDALTMTMSTDSNSANVTLETVRRIKAQGGRYCAWRVKHFLWTAAA